VRVVVRRSRNDLVVIQQPRRTRIVVALAELIVVQPAVGVAEIAAPEALWPLAQLEDRGVVLRVRARALVHVHVQELRERTQQLADLDGLAARRGSRRRHTVERVRYEG